MQEKLQESIKSQARPSNGPGSRHDQDLLDQLTLDSFTADPPTIPACSSEATTLSWHVTETSETRNVQFQLESGGSGFNVGPVGSLTVQLAAPTTFNLVASLRSASSVLGSVTINAVPNPACSEQTFPQEVVKAAVKQKVVDTFVKKLEAHNFKSRGDSTINVATDGVHIQVPLTHPDPANVLTINVDVDMTLPLLVENCTLRLTYSHFAVSAHYPPWVNLFAPGIVTFIELAISNDIEGKIKPEFVAELQDAMNSLMLGGRCLCHTQTNSYGSVTATLC